MNQKNESTGQQVDVVVFGAGPGGLTAAALLAKAGLKIVLVEERPVVGGYMAGFSRQGYHFNSSIEWLNECGPEGIAGKVFAYIDDDVPECPLMKKIFRVKQGDNEYLLTSDPMEMRDQLIRDFPGDETGIRKLFDDARDFQGLLKEMNRPAQCVETMSVAEKIKYLWDVTRLGLPISRYASVSMEKGLRRYFKTEKLRSLFCSQEGFMSLIVPIGWAMDKNYRKCPVGGSQVIADWLCSKGTQNGAALRLGTPVEQVLVNQNGAAYGVKLGTGEIVLSKYVLAASDTLNLYEKLIPKGYVPRKKIEAIREADLYHSSFSIFIGLDCPASELGCGEEALSLTIPDLPRHAYTNGDPNTSIITIISPSERDETMAPDGKGSLSIHCPAYMEYGNYWKTEPGFKTGPAYKEFKKSYAETILDRVVDAYIPTLREHIKMINISTPITFWRYTRNARGTTSSLKPSGKNIRNRLAGHRTPVKNLLLCGHGNVYGGGVPMAVKSGANGALIVMQKLAPDAGEDLKKVLQKNRS